jgi:hypothetical protein
MENNPETEQLVIQLSARMKDAVGVYAAEHQISMAAVARQALAKLINYNMAQESNGIKRVTKYATPEEAKQAALDKAKIDRALKKAVIEALKSGDVEKASKLAKGEEK